MHHGIAYQHPLWAKFPKIELSDLEIKQLVHLVIVNNDECAKETLINANGRRAMHIAGAYIHTGGDIDEMVSSAMLGLTLAVNKMHDPDFENINPFGYIASFIHQHCFEQRRRDRTIPTARNEKPIHVCSIIDDRIGTDQFDLIEFFDVMEKISKSQLEKAIVDLRAASYTDAEIAAVLDVSPSLIFRTRLLLYERFCRHDRR